MFSRFRSGRVRGVGGVIVMSGWGGWEWEGVVCGILFFVPGRGGVWCLMFVAVVGALRERTAGGVDIVLRMMKKIV